MTTAGKIIVTGLIVGALALGVVAIANRGQAQQVREFNEGLDWVKNLLRADNKSPLFMPGFVCPPGHHCIQRSNLTADELSGGSSGTGHAATTGSTGLGARLRSIHLTDAQKKALANSMSFMVAFVNKQKRQSMVAYLTSLGQDPTQRAQVIEMARTEGKFAGLKMLQMALKHEGLPTFG